MTFFSNALFAKEIRQLCWRCRTKQANFLVGRMISRYDSTPATELLPVTMAKTREKTLINNAVYDGVVIGENIFCVVIDKGEESVLRVQCGCWSAMAGVCYAFRDVFSQACHSERNLPAHPQHGSEIRRPRKGH